MEFDELKLALRVLDQTLERERLFSRHSLRLGLLHQVRGSLQRLWWGQIAQIGLGAALIACFAKVWVAHPRLPHVMVPAFMLQGYGLLLVLLAARTLSLVQRIDYAAPVIQIQRHLALLHRWRTVVEWPVLVATGCFIWIPMMLLVFDRMHVDLWRLRHAVVYWNLVSGLLCVGLAYVIVRWIRLRGGEGARRALEDSRAGKGVRRAREVLDEIARFENE